VEQPITHGIDLSRVTHRHGQSPDLEPKRQRAWERLEERERRYVVSVYDKPVTDWDLPFSEVNSAYERVLYVLVTTDRALSAEQIIYLMIARHYRNADITSIRKQLAIGVRQEHLRLVGHNRYGSTDEADEKLRIVEQQWRARRDASRVARVVRAAHAAGIESPDLSLGPEVPEVAVEPETPETVGETAPEISAETSAAHVASLEERFPGMTGEFEGETADDTDGDAGGDPVSDSPSNVAEDGSFEERFRGVTDEFEGEPAGDTEGDAGGDPVSDSPSDVAEDGSFEERFRGVTDEFEGEPAGDTEGDACGDPVSDSPSDVAEQFPEISVVGDEDDQSPSQP